MAIPLIDNITVKIDTGEEIEEFKIDTYIVTPKSIEKDIKKFEKKMIKEAEKLEEENKPFFDNYGKLEKKYSRLTEDIEDLDLEIEAAEFKDEGDSDVLIDLVKERRELRKKLRPIEDKLQELSKEAKEKREELKKLVEEKTQEILKEIFNLKVKDSENKSSLVARIEELGLDYSIVISEIGKLVEAKRKAKKKR